jgi:hypothetical protein
MKRILTTHNLIKNENNENDKNKVNIGFHEFETVYEKQKDLPLPTIIITGNYKKDKFLNNMLFKYNENLKTKHSLNFKIPIQYYFEYSENNSYYVIINEGDTFTFETYDNLMLYLKLNEYNENINNIVVFIKLKTRFYFRFSLINHPYNTEIDKKNIFSIIDKFENNLFVKTIICKRDYTNEDDIFNLKICHQSDYYYSEILKYLNNYYMVCMDHIKTILLKTKGK